MVTLRSRRITQSSNDLGAQATLQQRARQLQRAAVVAAPGRANTPHAAVPPRELLARLQQREAAVIVPGVAPPLPPGVASPLPRREILQRHILLVQGQLTRHQATLRRLEAHVNPEAGIVNPPPPYTPQQLPWDSAEGLWEASSKFDSGPISNTPLSRHHHRLCVTDLSGGPGNIRFRQATLDVVSSSTSITIQRFCKRVKVVVRSAGSLEACWKIKLGPVTMKRNALDAFFKPIAPKKPKYEMSTNRSHHVAYPFSIMDLPAQLMEQLGFVPAEGGKKVINDQLHLDMVYYQSYLPATIAPGLFEFLRQELPFYRVQYNINRGGVTTQINTPRYTTVFGIDDTSRFAANGTIVDAKTSKLSDAKKNYKCTPRPLPQCLDYLRTITERTTGETFNFCLVNYYADGQDSISYHSDDERFLGPSPAIASLTLGAKRDFLMKHKPLPGTAPAISEQPKGVKIPLGSGDMILMRGATQANWLHCIPKRAGSEANKGRINITFRKAMVKAGTENYYQYNVGQGEVFRWDGALEKMVPWDGRARDAVAEGRSIYGSGNGNDAIEEDNAERVYKDAEE